MAERLAPGQRLEVGGSLESSSGQYTLRLQDDGNMVLYENGDQPVWASGTHGQEVGYAVMQEDGNLVLYAPGGEAVWATDTYGQDGASLVLQDDRNLVIYTANGEPIWATDTAV